MKRKIVVAGNWKMNHTRSETQAFLEAALPALTSLKNQLNQSLVEPVLFVPYLSLDGSVKHSSPTPLMIGAQNAHFEKKGAFTGEISGPMLTEIGVRRVLVGHSERRQYFSETNATCFKKLKSLLEQGFNCMLCVGETLSERESGQTFKVIETQLSESLGGKALSTYLDGRLEIAYEPVWAIGTGKTASPAQAEEVHAFIRQFLSSHLSADAASVTPLLYGGSVTPDNFSELLGCPNIDGGLVGGSSLKSESFLKLVEIALTTH